MFKKVLVANRGEIAVRVLRACRELGLGTVAIYSDADRTALHVRYADEAHHIGPPRASESYLRIDKIIAVAKGAEADAVHPGYGFLAENPAFARACRDAGLAFIGPSPESMELMGDKAAARRIVADVGIPIVPGTDRVIRDADEALAVGEQIGYPLLVKAAVGGGGKGMRTVHSAGELPFAVVAARREAESTFGDGAIYLERLVEGAKHIEVQILGDQHRNIVSLGERECSLQRRHQKLIEEAPSMALGKGLRRQLGEAAIALAHAVDYTNVGTVEFLLDREKNYYFLEMNTRLQVEHPVTELVSGVDIVKEQLRIASGRALRYRQGDIKPKGWALECRICAEDPYDNFLPSAGRITGLHEPTGPGVRLDSGIYEGFDVGLHYDPLISKLSVWGETRGEAILRMRRALEEYRIMGVKTNIPFHQQMMNHVEFIYGQVDTTFVESRFAMQEAGKGAFREAAAIAATLVAHQQRQSTLTTSARDQGRSDSSWKVAGRWKAMGR
ncbi:MAG: acetyl-CoA carboxylase biotin carboxylase subunit [Anaerolineae bacterium]|nr:acetyl-CoA carboxylase biotin carboxylase subunit [Anaerolineae bacterium]NIN96031.1 acetyl-CoA carboxylase biotin carboxylase subunit [Anaerolineae bacterium]NIQ79061.1 acetyl-CoA carboxylase biotin carboxylase subunit [Anaerolineae bacterium]